MYGQVKFESDLPKVCFSTAFNADDKNPMDYFTCKTCKLNCMFVEFLRINCDDDDDVGKVNYSRSVFTYFFNLVA